MSEENAGTVIGVDSCPEECEFCGEEIRKTQWSIKLSCGTVEGSYCSKQCAKSDAWGPRFRGASIITANGGKR